MAEFAINQEFNGVEDKTSYECNVRLIHSLAYKAHRKLEAAGHVGMDYDDVFQEASESYLKAVAAFDPTMGFRFSTYFVTAFWRNFARTMEAFHKRKPIEAMSLNSMMTAGDDDEFGDGILSADTDGYRPDEVLWQKQAISYAVNRLDGLSKRVLEAMVGPSVELMGRLAEERGRTNMVMTQTKDGIRPMFQSVLRIDFVVRALTSGHNLTDRQIKTLTRKVRRNLSGVASELEAM